MRWVPQVYEATRLPAPVLEVGAKLPGVQDLIRANPFLPYPTWKALLLQHGSSRQVRYLTKNLDRRRAGVLLGEVPNLELDSRNLSEIDLALAAWYHQDEMGETTGRRVLASGLPNVANVALRSPRITQKLKAQLAVQAYRPNRLLWLTSTEADELGAETIWQLAALPENLEECCEGTMLDERLRTETLQYSAALLYTRPELLPKALTSQSPGWLMAAAAIPLTPSEQRTLREESAQYWKGEETEEILRALSRHSNRGNTAPDPVGLLGAAPWCSEETWEHLEECSGDPEAPTWVEGEQLVRRDPLGYTRTLTLRHAGNWPATELRSCTPEEAARWAEWGRYSDLLSGPFVALELRRNRHTGQRAARLRREALLRHSRALYGTLTRSSMNGLSEPHGYRHSEPEKESIREVGVAFLHCPMPEAVTFADGGFHELQKAGLTPAEWESALVLQDEFTGTVEALIEVVKAL